MTEHFRMRRPDFVGVLDVYRSLDEQNRAAADRFLRRIDGGAATLLASRTFRV
jgi:hypothetical protein